MKRKLLILCLFLLMLTGNSFAAPTVNSVSGTMTHDSTDVVVSGSGFGSKSTAAPKLWDKFENIWTTIGNGQSVPQVTSPWLGDTVSTCSTADQRTVLSTKKYYMSNSVYNYPDGFSLGSVNTVYISWWLKSDNSEADASKYGKFLRISNSSNIENYTFTWGGQGSYVYANGDCNISGGGAIYWNDTKPSANVWHFMEAYLNGSSKTWLLSVDGVTYGQATWTCSGFNPNYIWKVGIDSGGAAPKSQTSSVDDIYVDSSPQRVMICEGSSWSSRGKCEMQIPTAWSSDGTSITITINRGAWGATDTKYLYVVDSTNNANSTGKEVTFGSGGGGDTTAPTIDSITQSDPSSTTSKSFTINGTSSDAVGVTEVS